MADPETAGRRRTAERKGVWAERYTALYLTLKGYRLIARRVRTPVGEIDLIAWAPRLGSRRRLVFIEVKARATLDDSMAALRGRQRIRIERAAGYWLAGSQLSDAEIRFDLVAVTGWRLRHVRDAWRPR